MSQPAKSAGPFVGAHMSIAGGLHNAILDAACYRCRVVQLFSKSSNQWKAKAITEADLHLWQETLAKHPILTVVHDSYLINLASPDQALREKSRLAFLEEVQRCDFLSIPYLVFHPGAHMGAGETIGLERIAESLNWVCAQANDSPTLLLIETTAGQGSSLGYRFEHLARIMELVDEPQRFGVCVDTCHILAAGYDFRTGRGYRQVFDTFDRIVGLEKLRCFHVNDSKKDLGSRVDRHAHIGKGFVGNAAFRLLMSDSRFTEIPKVLETPKKDDMDRKNLALLRRLSHG